MDLKGKAVVVLLRGVNVGGARTFRPTVLVEQLKKFDVVNIGAAGTFVVRKPATQAELIEEFKKRLPFDTDISIFEGKEIAGLKSDNPFMNQPAPPNVTRFVSFLSGRPESEPQLPLDYPDSGRSLLRILARKDRFVFGSYVRDRKVISYLGRLDRLYGVPVTTRNWNTVTAIIKVLENKVKGSLTDKTNLA